MEKKWILLMGRTLKYFVYFIEVKGDVFLIFDFRI